MKGYLKAMSKVNGPAKSSLENVAEKIIMSTIEANLVPRAFPYALRTRLHRSTYIMYGMDYPSGNTCHN